MVNWKKTMLASAGGGESPWVLTITDNSYQSDNAVGHSRTQIDAAWGGTAVGQLSDGSLIMTSLQEYRPSSTRYERPWIWKFDNDGNLVEGKYYGTGNNDIYQFQYMSPNVVITDDDNIIIAMYAKDTTQGLTSSSAAYQWVLDSDLNMIYAYTGSYSFTGHEAFGNGGAYQVIGTDHLYYGYGGHCTYNGAAATKPSSVSHYSSYYPGSSYNNDHASVYPFGTSGQTYHTTLNGSSTRQYKMIYRNTSLPDMRARAWTTQIQGNTTSNAAINNTLTWSEYYPGASTSGTYDAYVALADVSSISTREHPVFYKLAYSNGAVQQAKRFFYNVSPYTSYGMRAKAAGTSPTGDVYVICTPDQNSAEDFVLLWLDSDLALQKAISFEIPSGPNNINNYQMTADNRGGQGISFTQDGSHLYIYGYTPYGGYDGSNYIYSNGLFVMKYPTDLSITGTAAIEFANTTDSPWVYNTTGVFNIIDITSNSNVTFDNYTNYSESNLGSGSHSFISQGTVTPQDTTFPTERTFNQSGYPSYTDVNTGPI
jgi:hypothetical protein